MPTRKKGESTKKYISRCVPILISEGKERSQAVATCYSMAKQKRRKR